MVYTGTGMEVCIGLLQGSDFGAREEVVNLGRFIQGWRFVGLLGE